MTESLAPIPAEKSAYKIGDRVRIRMTLRGETSEFDVTITGFFTIYGEDGIQGCNSKGARGWWPFRCIVTDRKEAENV